MPSLQSAGSGVKNWSPEVLAEVDRQIGLYVGKVAKHNFPAHLVMLDDVRQEAWLQALASVRTYDHARARAHGYFYSVVQRSVGQAINRWLTVVSISREMSRNGAGRRFQSRPDPDVVLSGLAQEDKSLARRAAQHRLTRARIRLMRAWIACTQHLYALARDVGEELLGFAGPLRSVEDVARQYRISVVLVIELRAQARAAVAGSLEYAAAHREVVLAGLEADE